MGGFVYVLGPCGSLQWTLLWGWESLPLCNPYRFLWPEVLRLCFPMLEPWVVWSLLLLSYSSWSSAHKSGTTWSATTSLLPVLSALAAVSAPSTSLNECFFFKSWLSDFHTVWFSGSSGYFVFLNFLLSFFACVRRQSVSPMPASWLEVNSFMSNEFV